MTIYEKVNKFVGLNNFMPSKMYGTKNEAILIFSGSQLSEGDDFCRAFLFSKGENPKVWENVVEFIQVTKIEIIIKIKGGK